MWGGDWYDFYIVEKENEAEEEASAKPVEVVWDVIEVAINCWNDIIENYDLKINVRIISV